MRWDASLLADLAGVAGVALGAASAVSFAFAPLSPPRSEPS
jgi:hypothetical protein